MPWNCRLDPFSTYRSTFEVRTYRLCRRALMFHHFAAEANVGLNCLVRSTDLAYTPSAPPADPTQPFYSFLLSATQTGYTPQRPGDVPFELAAAAWNSTTPTQRSMKRCAKSMRKVWRTCRTDSMAATIAGSIWMAKGCPAF